MKSRFDTEVLPKTHYVSIHTMHQSNDPSGQARREMLGRSHGSVPPYVAHAVIRRKDDKIAVADGWSVCSPQDVPNKQLGRFIARTRAIKQFHLG
jgi:hypothetical protein